MEPGVNILPNKDTQGPGRITVLLGRITASMKFQLMLLVIFPFMVHKTKVIE